MLQFEMQCPYSGNGKRYTVVQAVSDDNLEAFYKREFYAGADQVEVSLARWASIVIRSKAISLEVVSPLRGRAETFPNNESVAL